MITALHDRTPALLVVPLALALLSGAVASASAQTVNTTFMGNAPSSSTVMRTIMTGAGAPQVAAEISVGRFDMQ